MHICLFYYKYLNNLLHGAIAIKKELTINIMRKRNDEIKFQNISEGVIEVEYHICIKKITLNFIICTVNCLTKRKDINFIKNEKVRSIGFSIRSKIFDNIT